MSCMFLCGRMFPFTNVAVDFKTTLVFLHKNQWLLKPSSSKHFSTFYAFINPSVSYPKTTISASSFRPFTAKAWSNQDSYAFSYLVNSCGLSPEIAISASEKLRFETPERPNSVIRLLRNHGFSEAQIATLVRKRPVLLLANPEKTLLPKLEFFQSIGVSRTDLARTLSSVPTLLTRNLESQLIPSYNFLKSVLQSSDKVVAAMKRTSWIFSEDHTKKLLPNIEALRALKVPESCIALLLTHFPEAVLQKHDQFIQIVTEVREMGFDITKSTFVLAIHSLSGKGNKLIWNRCYEAYRKWGWSSDDILSAFRKHPHCMILSESKLMKAMDFFVNKMGWQSKLIAKCPAVLLFSLEKRIIPRCSVIQVLSLKGLIKSDLSLSSVLVPVEKYFLERFVTKYEEEVPHLLSVYQGKVDVLKL